MSEENQTTVLSDDTQNQITQEQYNKLQAEVERLRKHSETLLAEKSNKANSERLSRLKKSDLPKRLHAKRGILRR